MRYLILTVLLFTSPDLFAQRSKKKNIRWMQCKMQRGTKSQVKNFTLHKKYDLFVPFPSLYAYIHAEHIGPAGAYGRGYRFTIYVRDSKIGGMVQGKSSPVFKGPWWKHESMVEDVKHKVRIWCKKRY